MTPARTTHVSPELKRLLEPIDNIRPYHRNPRRGNVDKIAESLREHGQYKPILVQDETNEVLVGNHTLQAAIAEGWTHIAVQRRKGLTAEQAAKIVLVDNRTSDLATYDQADLAEVLAMVPDLDGTGYGQRDVDKILADLAENLQDPDPWGKPKRPKTAPGDRIQLGRHTLVCGDSTDANTWNRLLDGTGQGAASMVWTDPPYGVDLNDIAKVRGRDHGDMAGDSLDPQALYDLINTSLGFALASTKPGGAIYVCHADTMRSPTERAFLDAGWKLAQTLIWRKDSIVIGRQDYQWQHEPILYGWRPGAGHQFNAGRAHSTILEGPATREALEQLDQDTLIAIALELLQDAPGTIVSAKRPRVAKDHPTSKPVDLVAPMLKASSPKGGIVIDPFGGSGTTLIAAEQTDRTALLIELDPGYCDVICDRYETLTDLKVIRPDRSTPKPKTTTKKADTK